MTLPASTLDSNGPPVPNDEDVPVNKQTSFQGILNKYVHVSPTKPDTKRKPDSPLSSPNEPEPTSNKRAKPSLSNISDAIPSSPQRRILTRSRSSSSTPVLDMLFGSQSPTSTPKGQKPRSRGRRPQAQTAPSSTSTPGTPSSGPVSNLQDTIPPNLTLLFIGVNPGIMTGSTGFAYAHPSNLFWKFLHSSGITTVRHPPSDTYRLPELYNIGNTNIVVRPTRDASMLSKAEMDAGVPVLEAKVAEKRPEAVCLVGKSIWEAIWRVRKGKAIRKEEFRYGWQDESENMGKKDGYSGAKVFVATTTSGLAAGMTKAQKEAVWNELGSWVVSRREESKESAE